MPGIATQDLVREHRAVEKLLDELERLLADPERNQQKLQETFSSIQRDLGLHLRKEEDAYFPALGRYLPREAGPVRVMLHEHELLHVLESDFPKGAQEFIALLRAHIQKEDGVLFMIADQHFSDEEQQQVYEQMRKLEEEFVAAR